jgi:eukaryotic-like serine/threonine-protein kinase
VALIAGTRLGPYEIQSALGAGGMGEVYRARDTRLERAVAIKVLPEKLSSDVSLRLRLEREAKSISKLSHPHICTLHDVGHQEGMDFLVMELVEGETLEQRLMKGSLPAEQVLRYAAQIADALAKAHKLGITHRDLKPSNVMLTKSGAKLMDFGLAKQVEVAPLALALNEMTVEQSKLTGDEAIVGTFHYMAPEQLEAKEADARTDIFALGEVIYEMATGKPAFVGKSRASLIAAILTNEPPPISQLKPMAPPGLERVVKRCLAKDPEERWQNASDLAIELNWIAEDSRSATLAKARPPRRWLLSCLTAAAMFIAGVMLLWQLLLRPVPGSVLRASVIPGKDLQVLPFDAVLSPDGNKLAFVARSRAGQALWVRATDSPQVRSLPGTEDARYPFWSPDGQHIGFFAGAKLKTADLAGGAVITLADAAEGRGGSWNKADMIVFSPNPVGPLFRVPAGGGISSPLTQIDAAMQETSHRWPSFLPDGHRVLFYVEGQRTTGAPSADPKDKTSGLYLFDLETKEKKFIAASDSGAAYASGHLLYVRRESLVAQAFDAERGNVTGTPAALPQHQVAYDSDRWSGAFSVAANGLLAYVEGVAAELTELQWIDRSGKVLGKVAAEARYLCTALSPEGKRAAVEADTGQGSDIWIIDLERGTKARRGRGSPF